MVDPVGDGDGNREFPPLSVVYKYYEDDKLEDFISAATDMLEHDPSLDRYYTIQLLLLVANSVEDDADTLCYIVDAERLYKTARASSSLRPHEVENLDKLGKLLDRVGTLVYNPPRPKRDGGGRGSSYSMRFLVLARRRSR
ncbi:hypothetical protein PRZ48_006396 [Zasmidium cellare]|uniref:Uncharacterized protein n=1 Tax=Zasmidium cellare TaxID=395010 RepID=A0ABR0EMZ6_ZASCE|nr:hypothetical protein PRZ48_006396 [Zasmidium cellare]